MTHTIEPIGTVHSCFKELFGIPRQPGLVKAARGWIEFYPPFNRAEAFTGLEGISHLWVTFVFHKSLNNETSLTVRPPRKEGKRMGVFATRAPNRPNQIGQSVVELERIETRNGKVTLHIKGLDLVEGTPVIDIKPYIPYVDSIPDAHGGFAHLAPEQRLQVSFSDEANRQVDLFEKQHPQLRQLISDILQYDPRPVYVRKLANKKQFGFFLYDLDVKVEIVDKGMVQVSNVVFSVQGTEHACSAP
ncbi:tRNA (adenine(37)-N6)-methyltransferase [hydrothermal vent metagenome]|uniref:tRNA (Adenine(37)-N6)-methyltransferase n=1 Tax=hydrothermal vent metagenome TaxID=652676 RepID=A0A3B0Z6I8_9ZZZZ